MAQIQTYECDICKIQKKEVNHWWQAFFDCIRFEIVVMPIDVDMENVRHATPITHLCGFDCVTKWLHQQMQEIINRENANRTASTDKKEV